jgi:hypothetical protein
MVTFVPNSTFGRKTLRNVFESEATRVSAWLLNVPSDTVGDRSTWTWADNWKNYRVQSPFAYTTNTSVIDLSSQSAAPPSKIELFEDGVNVSPGAYYIEGSGADNNNQYTYVYNTGTQTITFTHYAVFVQEQPFSSLTYYATDVANPRTNDYLAVVKPFGFSDEDPVTLGPGQAMYLFFNLSSTSVGATCNNYDSYASMVDADRLFYLDQLEETDLYSPPYRVGVAGFNAYNLNNRTSPFFTQAYKNLINTATDVSTPGFLVELLNVTDPEPAFDAPFSVWSSYSINRFVTASIPKVYNYTEETDSYTEEAFGDTYLITFTSDKINLQENVEFVVTPPSSSSFTYTHLAVFLQPALAEPAPGQPYTHTDLDTFVGVIRLDSSVTMTSTSTARAYPFNLSLVYNPQATFEEL